MSRSGWPALVLVLAACAPAAHARPDAGGPADRSFADPRCAAIRGYAGDVMEPFLTRDGRFLLFNSSNAPGAETDLQLVRVLGELDFEYLGPLPGANSAMLDGVPTLASDGTLYFISVRDYARSGSTVFRARFAEGRASGATLVPGLPRERGVVIFDVEVSAGGGTLYYSRGVFRGGPVPRAADLRVATRRGDGFELDAAATAALAAVNTPSALEYAAAVSADGRELFFTRVTPGALPAVYRATRPTAGMPFAPPRRLAALDGFVEAPALSPDGSRLYYHRRVGQHFEICRVRRVGAAD
jgi:hypothetical protein